jgi:hypothetical protein
MSVAPAAGVRENREREAILARDDDPAERIAVDAAVDEKPQQ